MSTLSAASGANGLPGSTSPMQAQTASNPQLAQPLPKNTTLAAQLVTQIAAEAISSLSQPAPSLNHAPSLQQNSVRISSEPSRVSSLSASFSQSTDGSAPSMSSIPSLASAAAPSPAASRVSLADIDPTDNDFYRTALKFFSEGSFIEAFIIFSSFAESVKDIPSTSLPRQWTLLFFYMGICQMQLFQYKQAALTFNRFLATANYACLEDKKQCLVNDILEAADYYFGSKNWKVTIEICKMGLEVIGLNPYLQHLIAQAHMQSPKERNLFETGLSELLGIEKLVRIEKERRLPDIYFDLAVVYSAMGNYTKASKLIDTAVTVAHIIKDDQKKQKCLEKKQKIQELIELQKLDFEDQIAYMEKALKRDSEASVSSLDSLITYALVCEKNRRQDLLQDVLKKIKPLVKNLDDEIKLALLMYALEHHLNPEEKPSNASAPAASAQSFTGQSSISFPVAASQPIPIAALAQSFTGQTSGSFPSSVSQPIPVVNLRT